jgi:phosphoglycerate kinase
LLTAKKDVQTAEKILELLQGRVVLPSDLTANPKTETVYDIGPDSIRNFVTCLPTKGTIIWNGPLGIIESPHGQLSTKKIAAAIGRSQARSIIGGGETIEFLEAKKLLKHFSFVSTGGGAMLDFLSGEPMPGLEPLVI